MISLQKFDTLRQKKEQFMAISNFDILTKTSKFQVAAEQQS